MAQLATTEEDLTSLAKRLTHAFTDGTAKTRLEQRIEGKGMMFSPQLLAEVEAVQQEMFREWGYEPAATLQNLQGAVRKFPAVRPAIIGLCDAEESMINGIQGALAKKHNIELPTGAHGHGGHGHGAHGHGGHGHGGHGHGGHGHSHGGHGHSHGGRDFGPPGALVAHQIAMQLAQRGLTQQQSAFMEDLRTKMTRGQMPSGDDQLQAMQIQQTIMRKLQTMSPMVTQAMETLSEEERAELLAIEEKLKTGQPPSEKEARALETAKDSIATYIAMMGPMLMQMRQQQQQQQASPGQQVAGQAAEPPSEKTSPPPPPDSDKKKD